MQKREARCREKSRDITGGLPVIAYQVDGHGEAHPQPGMLCQAAAIANQQAWQEIRAQIARSRQLVASGKRSRLHYFMTLHQMDCGLMAAHTGLPRLLVRLHLRPRVFRRLSRQTLVRYSQLFRVSIDTLRQGELPHPAPGTPIGSKGACQDGVGGQMWCDCDGKGHVAGKGAHGGC